MKRENWIVVLSMIFLVCVLNIFVTIFILDKYFIPKVKTISMTRVLSTLNDNSYQKFLDGKLTQEEYTKSIEEKMSSIQNALNYYLNKKDILLIEEAVVNTNKNSSISITENVLNYVK